MSDSTTIARPYAKAIFEHALSEKQLALWSDYLLYLSHAILTTPAFNFLTNPATTPEQHIELLQSLYRTHMPEDVSLDNLIALLASNKRLLLLPEIKALYEAHKAEQEKTLDVDIISFSTVSPAQQQRMIDSLSRRLQRKVALKISIDPSLLGGAVVQAGDLVIDGSVRGKLNKLRSGLTA